MNNLEKLILLKPERNWRQ